MEDGQILFGDKSQFAIAAQVVRRVDRWLYGHFCFFIEGAPLGDYEEEVLLKTCAAYLQEYLDLEDRAWPGQEAMTKEALFAAVYDSIIVDLHEPNRPRPKPDASRTDLIERYKRRRLHLDHAGDGAFVDKYGVVLIRRGDGADRIVWRDLATKTLGEAVLPPGVFARAATSFLSWVRSQTV